MERQETKPARACLAVAAGLTAYALPAAVGADVTALREAQKKVPVLRGRYRFGHTFSRQAAAAEMEAFGSENQARVARQSPPGRLCASPAPGTVMRKGRDPN